MYDIGCLTLGLIGLAGVGAELGEVYLPEPGAVVGAVVGLYAGVMSSIVGGMTYQLQRQRVVQEVLHQRALNLINYGTEVPRFVTVGEEKVTKKEESNNI